MIQAIFFVLANAYSVFRFYRDGQHSFLIFFGICIGILSLFSILITKLRKNGHKSAGELMARTLTFWWMISLFGIALLLPPYVFAILLGAGSLLALAEYQTLIFPEEKSFTKITTNKYFLSLMLGCVGNYYLLYQGQEDFFMAFSIFYAGVYIPVFYVLQNFEKHASSLPSVILNFAFFAILLPLGFRLYTMSVATFLLIVFLTEIRDLVSYWLGKLFSKIRPSNVFLNSLFHAKIAETVSPNKTWWVGALSTLLMIPLGIFMNNTVFFLDTSASSKIVVLCGMVGILGLFGDLVFSLIKRIYGQKDSGTWLPGGSGIIDRIDALVFTLPAAYFILKFF